MGKRKYFGLGPWWLFLAVSTMIVEQVFEDVPLWGMVGAAVVLAGAALPLKFWHSIDNWRKRHSFDVPIRDAIRHVIHSTPHSYQNAQFAAEHYFDVLYEKMCAGKIGAVGRKGEDDELQRISMRVCKRHKPSIGLVPRNPSAPEGVRYCLVPRTLPPPQPLQETAFDGFTDLRVRGRDLYRIWPRSDS